MKIEQTSENDTKRLQDKVILIINGLSESGRVLAGMLSEQGADIVVISSVPQPELSLRIRQDVEANDRRCLLLTPRMTLTEVKKTFPQQAIQKIIDMFGHLDAFISYSAADLAPPIIDHEKQNGRPFKTILFDQGGLTKAALKQIVTQ